MSQIDSVLLIGEEEVKSEGLKKGLRLAGVGEIYFCHLNENFLNVLNRESVDFIVLDLIQVDEDLFERLSVVDEYCPKPVICFSSDGDAEVIANSVKAGVSAYIVDGKSEDRIKPIMEVAFQRFKACQAMKKELLLVKDKLSERATIEKAKGLLIQERKMSEDAAYSMMRKMAMDQGKKISVVAHEILTVYLGLDEKLDNMKL